jgi:pyridoxamine 5'-phosphate oxidase
MIQTSHINPSSPNSPAPQTANPTIPPWQELLTLAQAHNPQPHNSFAQLATLQAGSEPRPAVRTVALRFFLDDGRLLLSTDVRSEKVADLSANPACELCWYFTETREQFRLAARGHVIAADEARLEAKLDAALMRTWAERSEASRQSHSWPQPKRRLEAAAQFQKETPSQPPAHMALLLLEVVSVDYLCLTAQPHQRLLYSKLGGQWTGRAVNP